jgi:NAD(P)H-dependent FMN reductase
MTDAPVRIAVVIGSTREGRFADTVARWFVGEASARDDVVLDVVDLLEVDLPDRLGSHHPASGIRPEAIRPFAERIAAADGFVIVTPEYNHGYPASLKAALDALHVEWQAKPAAFVSYGGASGGIRAVEQLRQVLGELHMVAIRDGVALPMARSLFGEDGALIDPGFVGPSVKVMFDRLTWWARALRTARAADPYR